MSPDRLAPFAPTGRQMPFAQDRSWQFLEDQHVGSPFYCVNSEPSNLSSEASSKLHLAYRLDKDTRGKPAYTAREYQVGSVPPERCVGIPEQFVPLTSGFGEIRDGSRLGLSGNDHPFLSPRPPTRARFEWLGFQNEAMTLGRNRMDVQRDHPR